MNIGQLFQKGLDLYNAAKAGNYMLAVSIGLEILRAITDNLPQAALTTPPVVQGDKTFDECLEDLKACCENPPVAGATEGVVFDTLLPILKPLIAALIKKWLGL